MFKLGEKCELGEKCAVSIAFCGRQSSRVSGRNRIERMLTVELSRADSQAKGIRGEGSQDLT